MGKNKPRCTAPVTVSRRCLRGTVSSAAEGRNVNGGSVLKEKLRYDNDHLVCWKVSEPITRVEIEIYSLIACAPF